MFRLAWLTDIHLNFVQPRERFHFGQRLRDARADALVISGDIAEAQDAKQYLLELASALACPIYFVLGNHDYYFGSIQRVRRQMAQLCAQQPRLRYLTHEDHISLTPDVALIGHDGWADARVGDYEHSTVMLNDYRLIEELAPLDKQARLELLRQLGDEAGRHVRRVLPQALQQHATVLLATHVPPLREACWHDGQISDDQWAPHFTCLAVGEALCEVMRQHPHRRLIVLCGHTHGIGETRPLDNVEIYTGGAEYGFPAICRIWEFGP